MTLQEFYDRIGGDYKATISRLPSEALIKKFVLKYPGDPSFNQLKDALAAQDWELAFRASHTLKGVAQNLGMDRLYKTAATLCDAVRGVHGHSKAKQNADSQAEQQQHGCPASAYAGILLLIHRKQLRSF